MSEIPQKRIKKEFMAGTGREGESKISCLDYLRYEIQPVRGRTKAGKK